jgi:hypothetical protein
MWRSQVHALLNGFVNSFDLFGKLPEEKIQMMLAEGQIEKEAWDMVGGQLWGALMELDSDQLMANKEPYILINQGRLLVRKR